MTQRPRQSLRMLFEMRRLERIERLRKELDAKLKGRTPYEVVRDEVVAGRLTPAQAMAKLKEMTT